MELNLAEAVPDGASVLLDANRDFRGVSEVLILGPTPDWASR